MTDSAASTDDVWTVQRILQWTTDFLEQKSVESPRLEAELLLAHARNCKRINLYTDFEAELTDDERTKMRDFVKRRAVHEPLAYITGRKEFYGRDFSVGAGVLVPRPETETLVDICLDHLPKDQPMRVCEIGFGSGCIAVTLAKQRPNTTIVACDVSEAAEKFAAENVATYKVQSQVELVSGDGIAAIQTHTSEPFDGIVSNPPYIREDEFAALPVDVAEHEPREALVSGDDGLELIRRLIPDAVSILKPGGWMVLEIDPAQCETVAGLFREAGFESTKIHKDSFDQNRIVEARRLG